MDRNDPAYKGQSEYTPLLLNLYDPLVLGPIARFVWRCPRMRLVERYRQHIRDPHLGVGPGTGYFIAQSGLLAGSSVTILDPNPNVLAHASRRLRRFEMTAVEADVLKPLPVRGPFESAALHLVIHCLPGRSSARPRRSPTWPPSSHRPACSSAHRSSAPPAGTPGWRGGCSTPSTGRAPSTTSPTARRGSATSSARRSNAWSSTRLARSRSSRRRIRGRAHPSELALGLRATQFGWTSLRRAATRNVLATRYVNRCRQRPRSQSRGGPNGVTPRATPMSATRAAVGAASRRIRAASRKNVSHPPGNTNTSWRAIVEVAS